MIRGFNEPDEILSELLFEIALYGTMSVIAQLIIWLIKKRKLTNSEKRP
jgi:hypothetical protein